MGPGWLGGAPGISHGLEPSRFGLRLQPVHAVGSGTSCLSLLSLRSPWFDKLSSLRPARSENLSLELGGDEASTSQYTCASTHGVNCQAGRCTCKNLTSPLTATLQPYVSVDPLNKTSPGAWEDVDTLLCTEITSLLSPELLPSHSAQKRPPTLLLARSAGFNNFLKRVELLNLEGETDYTEAWKDQ